MNKNMKLALLIMATGLVLAGCASLEQKTTDIWLTTKWDKEAKNRAVIYFDTNVQLHKIDGKANVNMYKQEVTIKGDGTEKAPKPRLVIPSGERVLTLSFYKPDQISERKPFDVPYTFVNGRYYQLALSQNKDIQNPKFAELQAKIESGGTAPGRSAAEALAYVKEANEQAFKLTISEYDTAVNVEIFDITGTGKKKNTPSIIVTVKPWEQ